MTMEKRKMKDSISLLTFLIGQVRTLCPSYLPLQAARTLLQSISPIIATILPSMIIQALSDRAETGYVIALILATVLSAGIIKLVHDRLQRELDERAYRINQGIEQRINDAFLNMDYAYLEDPKVADLRQLARDTTNRASSLERMVASLFSAVANVLTFASFIAILSRLVASDTLAVSVVGDWSNWIAANSIIILTIAVLLCVMSACINKYVNKMYARYETEFATANRAYRYYGDLSRKVDYAKDIRLFGAYKIISKRIQSYIMMQKALMHRVNRWEITLSATSDLCMVLELLLVYMLIGCKIAVGAIQIGEFYLYVNAVTRSIAIVRQFLDEMNTIQNCLMYQSAYRDILHLGGESSANSVPIPPMDCDISFENVSFTYPGANEPVLRGVSFTFAPKQVTAIVGMNGAGKSTIIKLLLRLYRPSSGRILINGHDIWEYSFDAYKEKFSVVFQDFQLLACSIAENVAGSAEYDAARVQDCCERVGLMERIAETSKGIQTAYSRRFSEDGTEFSGGQVQRLAIARALYRDSPVCIMDEPTAALDPIAERDIFEMVCDCLGDRTTVLISHRLYSCRLCGHIIVLERGQVVQQGSHDELVAQEGLYRQMWDAQSQYYVNAG